MNKLPAVITAASVAALMATQVVADPTGATMNFNSSIVITGLAAGTGSGTGSGVFDSNGTLTIVANTFTNIPAFTATATVTTSTVYNGSISGTTWTSDGTTLVNTISCGGANSALICSQLMIGTAPGTTTVFSADINLGNANYQTVTLQSGGAVTLTAQNSLAPVPGGVVPPGDPNAIPTMPVYGLGLTIVALLGAAARRLPGLRKRE
jgi:hypothetical protein